MTNIAFRDLLPLLPRGDAFSAKQLPSGVSCPTDRNPSFVEPDLEAVRPIELRKTSSVLLSAPGAVGKSTLAVELARLKGAALWNLSQFQVGSRTFSGTIFDAYDFEATGVQKRIREGDFLIVFDALDEAQVRAGSQNFYEFLRDLATQLRNPRLMPTIVLLARSETAEWVQLSFEDADVPLAMYKISYFDREQANAFIELRLDARSKQDHGLHRQQSEPFRKARSALFNSIYQLLDVTEEVAWSDSRVRDFLGYAPVLEAFSEYLGHQNYAVLEKELQDKVTSSSDPWLFLDGILRRILDRESNKLRTQVRPALEAQAARIGWTAWGKLYTQDEQCARVLSYTLESTNGMESLLPRELADEYEESLKTFLPEHPFLAGRKFANVVFKEFVYAWGITRGGQQQTAALRSQMLKRDTPFLPSQLFGRFVVADHENVPVEGPDLGPLYESLLARPGRVSFSLSASEDGPHAELWINGEYINVVFEILDTGDGIHFWRRLSDASIDFEGTIRLGLEGQRFVLGPGVAITCGSFETACVGLDVDVTEDVWIEASEYLSAVHPMDLNIRNEASGQALTIAWPHVGHPWAAFQGLKVREETDTLSTERGAVLKKLIMMFYRQRTRKETTVRNARWSQGEQELRDELLTLALSRGVLRQVPGHSTFELHRDYNSLRTLITNGSRDLLSKETAQFVADFLNGSSFTSSS